MVGTTLGESSSKCPGPGSCKRFSWMFTSPLIGTGFLQNTSTSIVFPAGSQERRERDFLGNAVGGRINGSAEPLSYQVLLRDAALFTPRTPSPPFSCGLCNELLGFGQPWVAVTPVMKPSLLCTSLAAGLCALASFCFPVPIHKQSRCSFGANKQW